MVLLRTSSDEYVKHMYVYVYTGLQTVKAPQQSDGMPST